MSTRTETATQTKEAPAALGRRLAEEALPKRYSLSANKVRKAIVKRIAAHVRLPRAKESMSWKFKLDLAPLAAIREISEAAGLGNCPDVEWTGSGRKSKVRRTWIANGGKAASSFASLQLGHPLAWGGAKLVRAPKGAARKVSRVMTMLAPPLEVVHVNGEDEESVTIKGHLVTSNEAGVMRLPPNHEKLWGAANEATERVLKKYAKKTLGDMYVQGMPLSQSFKRKLGPQFESSDEEASDEDLDDLGAELEVDLAPEEVEEAAAALSAPEMAEILGSCQP